MTLSRHVTLTAARLPSTISFSAMLYELTSDLVKNFSVVLATTFIANSLYYQFCETRQSATFLPKTFSTLGSISRPISEIISDSSILFRFKVY
jgi:hypothetical protein